MDDDDGVDSNVYDYKNYYVGNYLGMNGYLSSSDVNVGNEFVGDNDDFHRLSHEATTIKDSKKNDNDIKKRKN